MWNQQLQPAVWSKFNSCILLSLFIDIFIFLQSVSSASSFPDLNLARLLLILLCSSFTKERQCAFAPLLSFFVLVFCTKSVMITERVVMLIVIRKRNPSVVISWSYSSLFCYTVSDSRLGRFRLIFHVNSNYFVARGKKQDVSELTFKLNNKKQVTDKIKNL